MHANFSEPELVRLGCMIGLTLGQQSWLRLLNIDHHQVLAGTDASMAPGYETADKLRETKSSADIGQERPAGCSGELGELRERGPRLMKGGPRYPARPKRSSSA